MKRLFPALCLLWLIAVHCFGGSATWNLNPATGDWNTASNWTPETVPNQPTDVATFGASNVTNVLISSGIVELDSIIYTPDAGAYTTDISDRTQVSGAGVVNNSSATQTFAASSCFRFSKSANAGTNVVYVAEAHTEYCGLESYGLAGQIQISDNSNGGNATFIVSGATADLPVHGTLAFADNSTAGNSTIMILSAITNSPNTRPGDGGFTIFQGSASAGQSNIVIEPGATLAFAGDSTAAHSSIFVGRTGHLGFRARATGGFCRVVMAPGARLSFPTLILGANPLTIGSVEGDGSVFLANYCKLAVGGNGQSTTFAGFIKGAGQLVKRGEESLTLTGANTYFAGNGGAGTTVEGGALLVDNTSGSATGTSSVLVSAGTFGGQGSITGAVTIGGPGAYLSPGIGGAGTLTILNSLTFQPLSVYQCDLNLDEAEADEVTATSVSITSGAQFSLQPASNQTLNTGTVFTVINNTGTAAISGTFGNLPDGGTIIAGPNTLRANYEGGDGNDLTLTVVP